MKQELLYLFLLFFIFSFLGWCMEVTLMFRKYHRFINRGFLTGPWLPIYGSGAVMITVAVQAFVGSYVKQWDLILSAALLAILPMIIVFIVGQKQIMSGMVEGAVKG